jgi:hypothetical protein
LDRFFGVHAEVIPRRPSLPRETGDFAELAI